MDVHELKSDSGESHNLELGKLATEVGQFIRYWGFKKIHGRIWTHMYLSPTPLDASTLMKRLRVSKALMSLSLHDLLNYNVIKPAGKSARGTQLYEANCKVLDVILNVLRLREEKMLERLDSNYKALCSTNPSEDSVEPCRLANLGSMINLAKETLANVMTLTEIPIKDWESLNDGSNSSLNPQ